MVSFYEMKSFIRALWKTDLKVSVSKCPGKWLYFIKQLQLFQINYINKGLLLLTKLKSALKDPHSVYSILRYEINRCLPKRVPFPG